MLGHLRYSLDECEEKFKHLCEKIYQPRQRDQTRQDFTSQVLLPAIEEIFGGEHLVEIRTLRNTYISCRV